MANKTVYPYGTDGQLPVSIGIINDIVTGGANDALSAQMGKLIGEKIDDLYTPFGAIDLGIFELGSINLPDNNGDIGDYASNVRIRMAEQQLIPETGEYTLRTADGYEFLIYVKNKLEEVAFHSSLKVTLEKGEKFRIAIRQVPDDVNYSDYLPPRIQAVASASGLTMIGPASVAITTGSIGADLDITDEKGMVLARFAEGHIQTKNFDSRELSGNKDKRVKKIDMGLPTDIPKVTIRSLLLTPDATNNTISPLTYTGSPTWKAGDPVGDVDTDDVVLEFESNTINFTDNIQINYQGATSLGDAKKGFGIDTHDKHHFGEWRNFDSFHLKAFYEDFIGCRDWVCNQLMEQIYQSRDADQRRPFLKHNDFGNDYRSFFGANTLCHVDGFPIELYINDTYWGLYIWRLKKDRNNYLFSKGNAKHIFLDTQWWKNGFSWDGVEVRNPKTLYAADGSVYDGDAMGELIDSTMGAYDAGNSGHVLTNTVKGYITDWANFMWSITTSTAKSDISEHFDVQEFIDCYLMMEVCNVWDSWSRNTLYGSWDGVHFAPMVYDMNNSFNGFGGKNSGTYHDYYPPTSNTYNEKARGMSWFVAMESLYAYEIRQRYNELKDLGVFTPENIVGLFDAFAMWAGSEAYGREASRWPSIPSLIGTNRDVDKISNIKNWIESRMAHLNNKYK